MGVQPKRSGCVYADDDRRRVLGRGERCEVLLSEANAVCERALEMLVPAANQLAAKMGLPPNPRLLTWALQACRLSRIGQTTVLEILESSGPRTVRSSNRRGRTWRRMKPPRHRATSLICRMEASI